MKKLCCGCACVTKGVKEDDDGETDIATFGMNDLWTAEAKMGRVPGVVRTRVGFMGGTEVVEVEFDTTKTSYEKLLETFWKGHDRCRQFDRSKLSAVFVHNLEQKHAAELSLIDEAARWNEPILTQIIAAGQFEQAPDDQQKYFLNRNKDIVEMLKMNADQLIHSHAACILNSFLGGYGTLAQFDELYHKMHLPEDKIAYIRSKVEELHAGTEF